MGREAMPCFLCNNYEKYCNEDVMRDFARPHQLEKIEQQILTKSL
jgi:hypothetical protein